MGTKIKIACKDCGRVFEMEQGEAQWYTGRGWPLPVRCKSCRIKVKKARQNRTVHDEG